MKKRTFNIIIVLLAAVIVACGIMAIGTMKGWFGSEESEAREQTVATEAQTEEPASDEETATGEEAATGEETSGDGIGTCTITIQCKSVLKNMDKLSEGKAKYIPSNGVILATSTIEFRSGETVYDILKRSCSAAGIPMSARKSSMGTYVEGINNLFEFDCGGTSGWLYSVNGSEPNHSSSAHNVKNGDRIVWHYTCSK